MSLVYGQDSIPKFRISVAGGNFKIGHGYITGIWSSVEGEKTISKSNVQLSKFSLGFELYFENGADKATVYNPTAAQLIHDRYTHESNTGATAKVLFYPFNKGFWCGLNFAAGPVIAYSIRTYETRAQLIQYGPNLSIRMSEIASDNMIVIGYKVVGGINLNLSYNWFGGVCVQFTQYHRRDLNTTFGIKVGYILRRCVR